jgi:hypothetical protein
MLMFIDSSTFQGFCRHVNCSMPKIPFYLLENILLAFFHCETGIRRSPRVGQGAGQEAARIASTALSRASTHARDK